MFKWWKRRQREKGVINVTVTLPEHKAGFLAGDEERDAVYRKIIHPYRDGEYSLEFRVYLTPGDWSEFENQPFYRDLKKYLEEDIEWKNRWAQPIHYSNNVIFLQELQFYLSPRDSYEIEKKPFYRDLLAYLNNLKTLKNKSGQ